MTTPKPDEQSADFKLLQVISDTLALVRQESVDDFIKHHHNPIVKQKNEEIDSLTSRLSCALEALRDIKWLFDGEADIDDNDYPNKAMKVDGIADSVLNSPGWRCDRLRDAVIRAAKKWNETGWFEHLKLLSQTTEALEAHEKGGGV